MSIFQATSPHVEVAQLNCSKAAARDFITVVPRTRYCPYLEEEE